MNRRGFLGAFLAAAVLDPERLLYVPGKKLISIPAPTRPEIYFSEDYMMAALYSIFLDEEHRILYGPDGGYLKEFANRMGIDLR